MIQNTSVQSKEIKNEFFLDTEKMKGAFTIINSIQTEPKSEEKNNCLSTVNSFQKGNKQLFSSNVSKQANSDGEVWQPEEIGRLFNLYDFYGPQWKIMSEQMTNRSANNLKNRFYTVLRNLIKLLFRKSSDNCPKLSGEIPSKDLSRLYDGKEDYEPFIGFVSSLLKEIDFDLESSKMEEAVEKYCTEIVRIYHTIYGERASEAIEETKQKQQKLDVFNGMLFPTSCSFQRADEVDKSFSFPVNEIQGKNPLGFSAEQQQDFVYFYFFQPSNIYLQGA